MIPVPWLLLRRRPPAIDRWRAAALTVTPPGAADLRSDAFVRSVDAVAPGGFERAREALLTYRFFPPDRVTGIVDTPDGRVTRGAVIVQRVRVGLVGFESGTRVAAVTDTIDEAGSRTAALSYVTLDGHPERGIATFTIAERAGGAVEVRVDTRSRPAAWWARLGWPLTRALQLQTNRRVVDRLSAILQDEEVPGA